MYPRRSIESVRVVHAALQRDHQLGVLKDRAGLLELPPVDEPSVVDIGLLFELLEEPPHVPRVVHSDHVFSLIVRGQRG